MDVTNGVIGDLLRDRSRLSPDLEAVVSPNKRLTFQEDNEMVNRSAHFLLENNIRKGDRVAILRKNPHPLRVPLSRRSKDRRRNRAHQLAAKDGQNPVHTGKLHTKGLALRWRFRSIDPVFGQSLLYSARNASGEDTTSFEHLIQKYPADEPEASVEKSDPALIIYTSGTTGRPKRVVCTHAYLDSGGNAILKTLDLRYRDRFLFGTPLFHISGMVFVIPAIIRGITMVINTQFHPLQIWNQIKSEKSTGMFSVLSMLNYLYEVVKTKDIMAPTLRMIACDGSRVPEDLIFGMYEWGFQVIQQPPFGTISQLWFTA
jgi:acyl-CoA synthetase (AMP-forming)/AMP-acid ligase II